MASLYTLERRLAAVEARLAEVEGGHGESIYAIRREVIANKINMTTLLEHFGLPAATEEQVDEALDEEV